MPATTGRVRLGSDAPQRIVSLGKQVWVITAHRDRDPVSQG